MHRRLAQQRVLDYVDAFYAGDVLGAQDCCDEIDSITYAPIELFPHLGHKHGKASIAEAIRIQQERYLIRRYEITFIAVDGLKIATTQRVFMLKRNDHARCSSTLRNSLPCMRGVSSIAVRFSTPST